MCCYIVYLQYIRRVKELEFQLKEAESRDVIDRDEILEENHYWKSRSEQLENSIIVLKRRIEDNDRMIDDLNTMNDELTKQNDLLKAELQNLTETTTAREIFLEMKETENKKKHNETQNEMQRLLNELKKKNNLCLNLQREFSSLKDKFEEIQQIHEREKGLYQNTLSSIKSLSQQEIAQNLKLSNTILTRYFILIL